MTTSKKLWVGFGTLIALLMLVSTAIVVRLQLVEQAIRSQADVSRPRAAAVRELEINLLKFAITLRTYLQTQDVGQREVGAENVAAVEKHLSGYLRLASTDRQRSMGAELAKSWREYRDLGLKLLDFPNRRITREEVQLLTAVRPQLEALLDEQMQPDAVAAYETSKEETFGDLHGVAGFALVLLAAGVVIAVLTSWAVGRGIVKAERRARANAERLRLGVEATSLGVWQVDYREDRIIWSERCREIFGLPQEIELTRQMVLERVHPDDRDLLVRATEESLRPETSGRFAVEHRVLTPDGEIRWVSARGRTHFDGANGSRAPALHTGVMIDVTDRKRAEDELRESESRFRRLANAMPQIVFVADAKGRIEFVNRRWVEFTGREQAASADLDAAIHPDDLSVIRVAWKTAYESGEAFSAELRVRRAADSEYRWFLSRSVPVHDADGRVVRWYGTLTDIHEQKQAEEALRASEAALRTSEERYRAFIANSTEGIWRLEFDPPIDTSLLFEEQLDLAYQRGRFAECNEVMARMYGLERPEDLIGRSFDFMLPPTEPAVREYLLSIFRNGYKALDVDSEERNAAGDAVYFSNSLVGVVEDGLLKRAWGTQRDVTERKRREKHAAFLAEIGAEFARLSSADEIMRFAGAKVAAYLDLSACTFDEVDLAKKETMVAYGWFRDDALSLLGGPYLHAEYVSEEFLRAARARETMVVRDTQTDPRTDHAAYRAVKIGAFVSVPFHRDGDWRFSLNACAPGPRDWRDDEIELFRDLAGRIFPRLERARAEAALGESEERFRTLADNISQLAWMADESGWIFWYNKRWYEYTGAAPAAQEGWGWQSVIDPRSLSEVTERWKASLAAREPFDMVFSLRRADGVFRPFLTRAMPVKDESGRVARWFGTNTDISEQRALEEALKEADRRKDEFLATLAHELRNPLAPIRNGLQILKLAGADAQAAEHARTMMERQLGQMIRLIDDLLDVSRISRGKIVLQRQPVDLASILLTAVETSRPLIEAQGHQLLFDAPRGSIVVDADATRLSQVFANLLNNAAKFTERGGRIELTAEPAEDEAIVVVRDTGVGIPTEKLTSVFELFAQVNGSLEKSQGGLGIGLTLVKSLVELHGGSVAAMSGGLGMGSEFVVRLPLANAEALTPAGDDGDGAGSPAPRKILVADDNADAAASLAEVLGMMGNEVRTAGDGLAALGEAEAFRPDVVLLDIGMPKLNGYDACRRLREHDWGRAMTIVALTGWGQEEDRRRSHDAGFDRHLVKPIAARTITQLLSELDAG